MCSHVNRSSNQVAIATSLRCFCGHLHDTNKADDAQRTHLTEWWWISVCEERNCWSTTEVYAGKSNTIRRSQGNILEKNKLNCVFVEQEMPYDTVRCGR